MFPFTRESMHSLLCLLLELNEIDFIFYKLLFDMNFTRVCIMCIQELGSLLHVVKCM